jgi:hypothetical protein
VLGAATGTNADPSTVRPLPAAAAAENLEQLQASLLEAAGSAVKPVWLTVECSACGERSRVEAPVLDVRSRVAAIELLLREGLGRAPQAEEPPAPRMPQSVEEVRNLSREQLERMTVVRIDLPQMPVDLGRDVVERLIDTAATYGRPIVGGA